MSHRVPRPVTRRRLLMTGAGSAALGLAGCLGDDDGNGDDGDDGSPSDDGDDGSDPGDDSDDTPEVDTELGDGEASEEVEIDVWLGFAQGDTLEEIAEDFNDASDTITVNFIEQGSYDEVLNSLIQSIRADEPPALATINAIRSHTAWAADIITPVENVIGEYISADDFFIDPEVAFYARNQELLGLPFSISSVTAQYNADALAEVGADPGDLTTFEDWTEVSQSLVDEGVTEFGITWPTLAYFWETYYAVHGQVLINNENGRAGPATEAEFDNEVGQQLFEWFFDEYDEERYVYSDVWDDARSAYLGEDAAFLLDTSAQLRNMVDGADFEHGVVPIPTSDGDREGVFVGGNALYIPRGVEGPQLEAAAEFLIWFTEPEQQAAWHMATGYYPATPEARDYTADQGFYDDYPQFSEAFDFVQDSSDHPAVLGARTVAHGQMRNIIDDGVERLLGEEETVDEMLASVDEEITSVLQQTAHEDPRD